VGERDGDPLRGRRGQRHGPLVRTRAPLARLHGARGRDHRDAFSLEGFAFFTEAIFLGVYLFGWNRLTLRAHWWSGVAVTVSGTISCVFVVLANA